MKIRCTAVVAAAFTLCSLPAVHAETVTEKWIKRYNGPANKADYGSAVAVDAKGNAIVTGTSQNASTDFEMYTAKYDVTDGHLLWERRYASVEGSGQFVRVDKAGDVIVAGSSGSFSNRDVYVVKYSGVDGGILWEKTYAGPATLPDQAAGMLLDGNGNVVILIRSASGDEFIGYTRPLYDFYTAKYNGDNGQLMWEKIYNGPVNKMDYARDLVLDGSGNVIVVGESDLSATQSAAHMIKYAAADGHVLWERNFTALQGNYETRAEQVAIDAAGNFAIAGNKRATANSASTGYAAKFSGRDGSLLWEINPTFVRDDAIRPAVAFDGLGDVFVAFNEYVPNAPQKLYLAKYSGPAGQLLWERNAPRKIGAYLNVLVDNNGHPILTYAAYSAGFNTSEIIGIYTVKYSGANGGILWEKFYEGPSGGDDFPGVFIPTAVGRDGSLVVTGLSDSGLGLGTHRNDFVTIRYTVKDREGGAVNGVLGPTTFTVRHSPNPGTNAAGPTGQPRVASPSAATDNELDAFLEFVAVQLSAVPGLQVQVQYSTLPSDRDSWFALQNGNQGRLVRDPDTGVFIAKSSYFPRLPSVYFRALISAPGHEETFSNVAGPFDLQQKPQTLEPTVLRVNFEDKPWPILAGQKLRFQAIQGSQAGGVTVRMQSTASPLMESSWTDLPNSAMSTGTEFGVYVLETNDYPSGDNIYFRAVTAAPGGIDSISNYVGPWKLTRNDLPAVQINLAENQTFSRVSPVPVSVTASDSNGISRVELYVDGELFQIDTAAPFEFNLQGVDAGIHSLIAFAYDGFFTPSVSNLVERVKLIDSRFTIFHPTTNGAWNDPSIWSPQAVPGANDIVEISEGRTVSVNGSVAVRAMHLAGNLTGPGTLTVNSGFSWLSGQISSLTLNITKDAQFLSFSDAEKTLNGVTINNAGVFVVAGKGVGGNTESTLNNTGKFTFAGQLGGIVKGVVPIATFGTVKFDAGQMNIAGGLFVAPTFTQNGGHLNLGSRIVTDNGAGVVSDNGLGVVSNHGGSFISEQGGALAALQGAGVVSNHGGSLISDNGACVLNGGSITGFGRIDYPNFNHNGGFFQPGSSPGAVDITGNYTQGADARLILEVGGTDGLLGDYDVIAVHGTAHFAGDLILHSINGFQSQGTGVVPFGYASATGQFKSVSSNGQVTLGAKGALVKVDGPNPQLPKALNISTRLQIQGGDNALFAGFIITGPAGSTKKVLIRGIGPSLAQFGVPGTIPDPFLELHTSSGTVTNDNWQQAPNANEIPNGLAPGNTKESVIIATLGPGNYSAILKGAHGETGVGLAEVYDLEPNSGAQLANIATRGLVQTGDNVLIGGFIIAGNEPAKILVRAIGPSLSAFGLQGALQDTTLELHDANGGVIGNNDWRSTQQSEIIDTTIPPSHDREASVLAVLTPGNYTAVVRGADDTTGIAVVEAYNLR